MPHALARLLGIVFLLHCLFPTTAPARDRLNVSTPHVPTIVRKWNSARMPAGAFAPGLSVMSKQTEDRCGVYSGTYTPANESPIPVVFWDIPMWHAGISATDGYMCPRNAPACMRYSPDATHPMPPFPDFRPAAPPSAAADAGEPPSQAQFSGMDEFFEHGGRDFNTIPGVAAQLAYILPPPHFLLLQEMEGLCARTSRGGIACGGHFNRQQVLYGALLVAPSGRVDVFFYGSRNNGRIRNLAWHYTNDRQHPDSLPPDLNELVDIWDFDGWPPLVLSATTWLHASAPRVKAVTPPSPASAPDWTALAFWQGRRPVSATSTTRWTMAGDATNRTWLFDVTARQSEEGPAVFTGTYAASNGEHGTVAGSFHREWYNENDVLTVSTCPDSQPACATWRAPFSNGLVPPAPTNDYGPEYPAYVYFNSLPGPAHRAGAPMRPFTGLAHLDGLPADTVYTMPGVAAQLAGILPPPLYLQLRDLLASCTRTSTGSLACGGTFDRQPMEYGAIVLAPSGRVDAFFHDNRNNDAPPRNWHYTNDRQHPDSLPPDMDEVLAAWDFSPYARPTAMTDWWHASAPGNRE